ncbi:MAG: type II secretion system protein [Rhodocyclaceae bacterium]|nr:type II secretion system protein [Rhodocyclaceae bacterium]MBX3667287.1 type II secretion system protein [Rhodocyclaceae bacterium]
MRARGFTLIEIAVVLAIVAILASMALPLANLANTRAKEEDLRRALREIRSAIDAYKRAYDDGRMLARVGASGYPPDLEVLVNGVEDVKSPSRRRIYFLRRLPRDPFYPDNSRQAAETWGKRAYASPPDDPSDGEDVYDVYSLSPRRGINGVPYRQW